MIVFIVEGKLAGNAALFYESAYISSVLLRKAWWCCCDFFLNLVLHIWCCTVFICLFSFFFFFKVCWSFENVSILNNGALIGLREKKNEGIRFFRFKKKKKKGKPLALITSYHFIQQHQVSVFHSALYCSALWICCRELCWRNIYKDLAFIIWFLFSSPHSTYTV